MSGRIQLSRGSGYCEHGLQAAEQAIAMGGIKLSGPSRRTSSFEEGQEPDSPGGPGKGPSTADLLGHPGLIKLSGPAMAPDNPLEGATSVPNPEVLRKLQADQMPLIQIQDKASDVSQNLPSHIQDKLRRMQG